jgi:hypothetical protein
MARRLLCDFLIACTLVLPSSLAAQGPSEDDKQRTRDRLQPVRVDPASVAPLRVPVPQFTLVAEKGKQEVRGTVGVALGDTTAHVELAGPISEQATEASPLTLSSLANGARVTIALSRNRLFLSPSTELLDAMEQFCISRRIDPCAMSRTTTADERRNVEICTPLTSGGLRCRETRLAAPVLATQTQFGVELRRRVESIGVGIAPRFEYRFDDENTLFDLPVYFLRDTSEVEQPTFGERLNGGVSVGWQTGEGLVARAFIGVAFDLLRLP